MKALNNIKFVSEVSREFETWLKAIDEAENYDQAKQRTSVALGIIDCMCVYLNTMIDKENNDFTGDLGETLEDMETDAYQHLINKAIALDMPDDIIWKLLRRRDGEEEA